MNSERVMAVKQKRKRIPLPVLTAREIISELDNEIRMYRESYAELDGRVTAPRALRTIAALSQAAEIVSHLAGEPTAGDSPFAGKEVRLARITVLPLTDKSKRA